MTLSITAFPAFFALALALALALSTQAVGLIIEGIGLILDNPYLCSFGGNLAINGAFRSIPAFKLFKDFFTKLIIPFVRRGAYLDVNKGCFNL